LQNANVSETVKSIAKFEQTRLNFFGYGKRFSLCFLKHDIRETLSANAEPKSQPPHKKQLLYGLESATKQKIGVFQ